MKVLLGKFQKDHIQEVPCPELAFFLSVQRMDLEGPPCRPKCWVGSGSSRAVRNLAGWVTSTNDQWLPFCILLLNAVHGIWKFASHLNWLIQHPKSGGEKYSQVP